MCASLFQFSFDSVTSFPCYSAKFGTAEVGSDEKFHVQLSKSNSFMILSGNKMISYRIYF